MEVEAEAEAEANSQYPRKRKQKRKWSASTSLDHTHQISWFFVVFVTVWDFRVASFHFFKSYKIT